MKRVFILLGGIFLLAALTILYQQVGTHTFNGYVLKEPIKVPQIVLRSDTGPVRLNSYSGKIVLLYFGYTSCPDICPASLANLKLALGGLSPEEAAQVQVIFISVDPARDTPEALGKYVKLFRDDFIGATGTRAEIDWVTSSFDVQYKINPPDANGNYSVDHTAFTIVIDQQGYYVMNWPHNTQSTQMSADLHYLLQHPMPISAQILSGPTYTPVVCSVTLIPAHVQGGEWLYQHHCAQCHGADLAGNSQWQTQLADGSHLPPPLNGSGNAWKIPPQELSRIVKEGRNLDNSIHMPAFKPELADWEIDYILTYVESKWDINQLNYQHGFMTLTPQATTTPLSTPAPVTPPP